MPVLANDTYTVLGVTRESSGEYKCSLLNDENMQDSKEIIVHCESFSIFSTRNILAPTRGHAVVFYNCVFPNRARRH